MEYVKYPIGKFNLVEPVDERLISAFITQIECQADQARKAITGLNEMQIDTPLKAGGWTVRQIIHHLADAHINAYVRFKLALTEDKPAIKLWDEVAWAECEDGKNAPIDLSITILEAVHARWVVLLKSLDINDFLKEVIHPELGHINLSYIIQLYAWHGKHHIGQIKLWRE